MRNKGFAPLASLLVVAFLAVTLIAAQIAVTREQNVRSNASSCTTGYISLGGCCGDGLANHTWRNADCTTRVDCNYSSPACKKTITTNNNPPTSQPTNQPPAQTGQTNQTQNNNPNQQTSSSSSSQTVQCNASSQNASGCANQSVGHQFSSGGLCFKCSDDNGDGICGRLQVSCGTSSSSSGSSTISNSTLQGQNGPCSTDANCQSGLNCRGGICQPNTTSNSTSSSSQTTALLGTNQACSTNNQCQSNYCDPRAETCQPKPTSTTTTSNISSNTSSSNSTSTQTNNCTSTCQYGCTNGVCNSKPATQTTGQGTVTLLANNKACSTNNQCQSNYCDPIAETCQTKPTTTTTNTSSNTSTSTSSNTNTSQLPSIASSSNVYCSNPDGCSCPGGLKIAVNLNCSGGVRPANCSSNNISCLGNALNICISGASPVLVNCPNGCDSKTNACITNPNPTINKNLTQLPQDEHQFCGDIKGCQCPDGKIVPNGKNCFGNSQQEVSQASNSAPPAYCDTSVCKNGCKVNTSTGGICNDPPTTIVNNISANQCSSEFAGCPGINNSCVPHGATNGNYRCCFGSFQDIATPCGDGYFESKASCQATNGCYYPNIGSNNSGTCIPNGSYLGTKLCEAAPLSNGQGFVIDNSSVNTYFAQRNSDFSDIPIANGACNISYAGCGPMSVANIVDNFQSNQIAHTTAGVSNFMSQNYSNMTCQGTGPFDNKAVLDKYGLNTVYISCKSDPTCMDDIKKYLQNGAKVLARISVTENDNSPNAQGSVATGHFVMMNGVDSAGNITVVDPAYQAYRNRNINIIDVVIVQNH